MKLFIVALIFSSFFLYFFIGDTSAPFPRTLGKEQYAKSVDEELIPHATSSTATSSATKEEEVKKVTHIRTPKEVKAIYMSSWVAGTPSVRKRLIDLVTSTELNAIVIDVKDNTGTVSWDGRIGDLDKLISELHGHNIYVIARIASFQDPLYVKLHPELAVQNIKTKGIWKDRKGVPWVDTGSKQMWEYLVALGKEAHARGFDELNYDYIRFPTDGDLSAMRFPVSKEQGLNDKRTIVKEFYRYLHDQFFPLGIPISGDLFGIIATNSNETKTLGQDLSDGLTYFDYVSLMVYPSHFYPGTAGFQNPAAHPYEIIDYSTKGAVMILEALASSTNSMLQDASSSMRVASSTYIAKLRPWYQDFDMGATYTKEMVRAQITAGEKYGVRSWMLWDPANRYTKSALNIESSP